MAPGATLAPTQPGFHVSQAEPKMYNQQSCRPLIGQGATTQDDSGERLHHRSQTRHFLKTWQQRPCVSIDRQVDEENYNQTKDVPQI